MTEENAEVGLMCDYLWQPPEGSSLKEKNTMESVEVILLSDKCEGCLTEGIRCKSRCQTKDASNFPLVTPWREQLQGFASM